MSTVVRMITRELDRAGVVAGVIDRHLSQRDAARQLGVTAHTAQCGVCAGPIDVGGSRPFRRWASTMRSALSSPASDSRTSSTSRHKLPRWPDLAGGSPAPNVTRLQQRTCVRCTSLDKNGWTKIAGNSWG